MNILILGHGKSGTTIFLFQVAAGLLNCQAFSGGDPVKCLSDYENAVYKYTYNVRKGRSFDLFRDHSKEINYVQVNTDSILRDLDTPADYANELEFLSKDSKI